MRLATFAGCALAALALAPAAAAAPGQLDPAFDRDGLATLPFADELEAALVQPDGRIVVAGQTALRDMVAWRLNADGTPDAGFGVGGRMVVDFGGEEWGSSAALLPDGRLVLGGTSNGWSALARLNRDGSLDRTFDGDGRRVIEVLRAGTEVVALPDGALVLAGDRIRPNGGGADFGPALVRPNGTLDATAFDAADFGGDDNALVAAAAPGGGLVVAGVTSPAGVVGVARYRADGALDTAFGEGGKALLGPGLPHDVIVHPDGKVAVLSRAGSERVATVSQLTEDGGPDPTFGANGVLTPRLGDPPTLGMDVVGAAAAGGRLVVATMSADFNFSATRLAAGGAVDPGFGTGGTATADFGGVSAPTAAVMQPDGALVLAGTMLDGLRRRGAVARLLGDPKPTPGPGPGTPAGDPPPALSGLRVLPRRSQIRFTLSEPARVQLVFRRGRHRVRRFAVEGRAGRNRARYRRRRLARRRYTVIATPIDRAGQRGAPRRASFRLRQR